ncbi:MAG: hypothetical protein AB8H79_21605 [Myxococcota bacterium]
MWQTAGVDRGPFAEHAEGALACLPTGIGPELGGFEIDTTDCPYASLEQPALARGRVGDTLVIEWWHQALAALEPSTGHLALTLEDEVIWEREVPIPNPAQTYRDEVELPIDIPRGTPVLLHLHNHGANTWNVFHVQLGAD